MNRTAIALITLTLRSRLLFCAWSAACLLGLACSESASALEILASDRATHQVLRFDADTGASKGVLVSAGSGGLFAPTAMTIGFDGDLFVSSFAVFSTGNAQILRYSATTGQFLGVFADTGAVELLGSLLYSPTTNTLLAGALGPGLGTSNVIYQFDSLGAQTTNIVEGNATGRTGLVFGPSGNLFASTFTDGGFGQGGVREYDTASAFAPLGYYIDPDTEGLPAGLFGSSGLLFDGSDLIVAGTIGQNVVKFDSAGVAGAQFGENRAYPSSLLIAPDGNLLVTDLGNDNPGDPFYGATLFPGGIYKYDINTGATIGGPNVPFVTNGEDFQPTAMLLVDDLPFSAGMIPEPSSLVLLLLGIAPLMGRRRR